MPLKSQKMKTVKISEETHAKLKQLGKKGDTFNDIIERLIDKARQQK